MGEFKESYWSASRRCLAAAAGYAGLEREAALRLASILTNRAWSLDSRAGPAKAPRVGRVDHHAGTRARCGVESPLH
jgi:hypothetical protein